MKLKLSLLLFLILVLSLPAKTQEISIGSKLHPESRLLAEIMAQMIEQNTDLKVRRRFGLGGTLICFKALETGEIAIYPEYTGTVFTAILKQNPEGLTAKEIYHITQDKLVDKYGIIAEKPFGFNNTYALATRPETGLTKISDLANRTDLNYGFSNEFIARQDGFQGLNAFYNLGLETPRGMDHGLAYKALSDGSIDVTDAYSTDGRLESYNFVLLKDDRKFFPPYDAIPLVRADIQNAYPGLRAIFAKLAGLIDEKKMQQLNYRYEVDQVPLTEVASDFLNSAGLSTATVSSHKLSTLTRQLFEHIRLTLIATLLAVIIALPLGIYIHGKRRTSAVFLSVAGIFQTIPSLALLGFMIPLFGIGFVPAIIALFLYALLPVLRNTYTGLASTDPLLIEAGRAMGMTPLQLLLKVRLPLAASTIMAGIRTALTINIGTATLAAFIGAGGLGESIITGIALNDNAMILRGAIPAALLAIIAELLMAQIEKAVRPKGVQLDERNPV